MLENLQHGLLASFEAYALLDTDRRGVQQDDDTNDRIEKYVAMLSDDTSKTASTQMNIMFGLDSSYSLLKTISSGRTPRW